MQVQGKNTRPSRIGILIEGGSPIRSRIIHEDVQMGFTLLEFLGEALAVFKLVEIGGDRMGGPRALVVRNVSTLR